MQVTPVALLRFYYKRKHSSKTRLVSARVIIKNGVLQGAKSRRARAVRVEQCPSKPTCELCCSNVWREPPYSRILLVGEGNFNGSDDADRYCVANNDNEVIVQHLNLLCKLHVRQNNLLVQTYGFCQLSSQDMFTLRCIT